MLKMTVIHYNSVANLKARSTSVRICRIVGRVLARIPNLAVQICLWLSSRIFLGVVRQKHVFWDVAAIFFVLQSCILIQSYLAILCFQKDKE